MKNVVLCAIYLYLCFHPSLELSFSILYFTKGDCRRNFKLPSVIRLTSSIHQSPLNKANIPRLRIIPSIVQDKHSPLVDNYYSFFIITNQRKLSSPPPLSPSLLNHLNLSYSTLSFLQNRSLSISNLFLYPRTFHASSFLPFKTFPFQLILFYQRNLQLFHPLTLQDLLNRSFFIRINYFTFLTFKTLTSQNIPLFIGEPFNYSTFLSFKTFSFQNSFLYQRNLQLFHHLDIQDLTQSFFIRECFNNPTFLLCKIFPCSSILSSNSVHGNLVSSANYLI